MFALDAKDNAKEQVPAVVHVNGTCRIQTVNQNQNIVFYNLISEFYKKTGIPMLMNTSFNLSHEPIIETVEGAFESCRNSGINYLYMPDIKTLIYFK
jgi:carbamoyltransferase